MGAGASSDEHCSTQSPNAYCTLFSSHAAIRPALGNLKVLLWALMDGAGAHQVRLEHDIFSGRRLITVDGATVFERGSTLLDRGSSHAFTLPPAHTLRCVVTIHEASSSFAYSLCINEQSFARFRSDFWNHSALWYVPRNGRVTEEAVAAAAAAAAADAATPTIPSSSPSSSSSSSSSSSALSPFHTVVVLTSPDLVVLLNGRVAELQSAFSAGEGEESTTHSFLVPREGRAGGGGGDGGGGDGGGAGGQKSAFVECELTVWLDKGEAPVSSGTVVSHVPRGKKASRMRFSMRVDGVLLPQAPSPIASVHESSRQKGSGGVSGAGVVGDDEEEDAGKVEFTAAGTGDAF